MDDLWKCDQNATEQETTGSLMTFRRGISIVHKGQWTHIVPLKKLFLCEVENIKNTVYHNYVQNNGKTDESLL